MISRAPLLQQRYPPSQLIRTLPPPSRLRQISRCHRLYYLPCSADFSVGRGRLLQLLGMSLSPCCRYHPVGAKHRVGQNSALHAVFAQIMGARPPKVGLTRPPMRLLSLRPGDSLTIPWMALPIGFRSFGFPPACYPGYAASGFYHGGTDSR